MQMKMKHPLSRGRSAIHQEFVALGLMPLVQDGFDVAHQGIEGGSLFRTELEVCLHVAFADHEAVTSGNGTVIRNGVKVIVGSQIFIWRNGAEWTGHSGSRGRFGGRQFVDGAQDQIGGPAQEFSEHHSSVRRA